MRRVRQLALGQQSLTMHLLDQIIMPKRRVWANYKTCKSAEKCGTVGRQGAAAVWP